MPLVVTAWKGSTLYIFLPSSHNFVRILGLSVQNTLQVSQRLLVCSLEVTLRRQIIGTEPDYKGILLVCRFFASRHFVVRASEVSSCCCFATWHHVTDVSPSLSDC
jgi:hypothetical protein